MPLSSRDVAEQFAKRFDGQPPLIVRAPGRVNLIGEHTDYNDGFVLPLAIDRAIWIALKPCRERCVQVYSVDNDQTAKFSLDNLEHNNEGWPEYLKGTASCLAEDGFALSGWEGIVMGDVPIGAGLSSSAALELATARAFAAVSGFAWDAVAMARLGQRAENEWVGMRCGIMDQLISATGQAGHAVLIDCRSLQLNTVPLPPGLAVVVLDTSTRRGLVDSAYNERRSQCEAAAEFFQVPALRDVAMDRFVETANELNDTTRRRAMHVITENDRTLQAAEAMRRGDAAALGVLMNKSHESLRDDYEVSSDALNAMVDAAQSHPACHGARMTGAGFGGCAVAIVDTNQADDFAAQTGERYREQTGHTPAIYVCQATDGAGLVEAE